MHPSFLRKKHSLLFYTATALISGLILGMLLRVFPAAGHIVADYVLTPAKTMYLNALKLVVTPVVFFSIAASIAGISDYKAYGRVGAKVVLLYMFTSAAAILVGLGLAFLLSPGTGVTLVSSAGDYAPEPVSLSVTDTIINLIPSDPISPFSQGNMTQIIFLALLLGYAAGLMEQKSGISYIRRGISVLDQLFRTVSGFILRLIPLGTFCAVALLALDIDLQTLFGLAALIGTVLLGTCIMLCLYGLLFYLVTGLSPLLLLKKALPSLTSFALLCSTSAVLPQTIRTCVDRLGIDPEICTFSLPLGSTINMDGACVYLTVCTVFLAQMYGITLTPALILQLGLTTLLLSVGAPPMPGSGFICLSVLVMQLGLPVESIGLLLGIDQLMSMCRTVTNGAGDIVCTAVVAFSEKRMNCEVFQEHAHR